MATIDEARDVLKVLGLPPAQQKEMAALTLLALCGLKPDSGWNQASRYSLTLTKGIMYFVGEHWKRKYAANTRETFRRQVLHQFVQAHIADYNPDDLTLPTNSPRAHYALTAEALEAIRSYGTKRWSGKAKRFVELHGYLHERYQKLRIKNLVSIHLPEGISISLSPGRHNELQAAIIEKFTPRFAAASQLLYLGDTADKNLYCHQEKLRELGIVLTEHDKLPDIVLYDEERNWLFLIEAVTSHGPMTPKRISELSALLKHCHAGCVYVSAFADFAEFRRHLGTIAWETEVWIAENPDHLIHFNGDRFLGPR